MEWQDIQPKQESQAYLPESGEKISTLNGVETAHANSVVVQHRATEDDVWQVFVTDRETFDSRYWHNLWGESQLTEENSNEENQEVTDAFPVSDEDGDSVESDYNEYTVPELREILGRRELNTSGNKPELVARLEEHDRAGADES